MITILIEFYWMVVQITKGKKSSKDTMLQKSFLKYSQTAFLFSVQRVFA